MKPTTKQYRMYRWQVGELARVTEYDDPNRRALMERVTGKTSSSSLTKSEMKAVIGEQARVLNQTNVSYQERKLPERPKFSQDEYLALLVAQLGWKDQPGRLEGFVRRQFSGWKGKLEDLTVREKSKLITALKKLRKQMRAGEIHRDRPPEQRAPRAWTPRVVPGGRVA